jgi:hypothetical protein
MEDWIPFREGSYIIECGYLMGSGERAVTMEDGFINVYVDRAGKRQMSGQGYVRNVLMVELLEDGDEDPDLILDMGEGFRFLLKTPQIQAGKLFSPEVKSIVHFAPTGPLEHLSDEDFASRLERTKILKS